MPVITIIRYSWNDFLLDPTTHKAPAFATEAMADKSKDKEVMRNILLLIAYTLLAIPFLMNARSSKGIFNAVAKDQGKRITSEYNKGASLNAYNAKGYTPVQEAVIQNKPKALRALLEAGADVERTTRGSRETALHLAAKEGNTHLIKILRNFNADPTRINTEGKTAADTAQENAHSNIVGLLK